MATAAPPLEAHAGISNAEALQLNDELVDALMLLDYECRFCNSELKPLSRIFFTSPAQNTANQFKYFSRLVGWGLSLIRQEPNWDEYDDPNTIITNILVALKELGVPVNTVPGKLRQGYGDDICRVLHGLFNEILRLTNFKYLQPEFHDEGLADEAEVDSDAEIVSDVHDDIPGNVEDDDLMYQEQEVKPSDDDNSNDHEILHNNIDPTIWALEVERAVPKLKVQIPNDSNEWRTHLSQTRQYKQIIEQHFPDAKGQLGSLSKELNAALEKIRSKENFINTQFDHRALDYRQQQEELNQVQQQYAELNEVVMNYQIELKTIAEELENVKNEMENHSSTVTDTAPIVKMKEAFKKLRCDTRQLEVRIGVVNQTLTQASLIQGSLEHKAEKSTYLDLGTNEVTSEAECDLPA
jgi:estrogen-related receptor beta like 1